MPSWLSPRLAILAILVAATATIAGALASQHVFGLAPCKLCLWQRYPFYVAVPLGALLLVAPHRTAQAGLAVLAAVFVMNAGLGGYHAGVEWGVFAGPSDCGGGAGAAAANVDDFLKTLGSARVVSCTEAAWRFLGLSLAGWNALISAGLAVLAAAAALRPGPYGSSSVSQYR